MGVPIVKSGTDFREFSAITVSLGGGEDGRRHKVHVDRHVITSDIREVRTLALYTHAYNVHVHLS